MTDLNKGRILVTGGAGFIGSAIVWALNQRGLTNILITDFLDSSPKWKNLPALRFADYIEADDFLTLLENSTDRLTDIRTIFHLGACSSTTETDAAYLIRNSFEYTKKLAHFAMESGRRFVYASSAATYGALEAAVTEDLPLHNLRPLNMYGYAKHLFDCYAERTGMLPRITGLKYFNIFGPNEEHKGEMRSLVGKAYEQIQQYGRLELFKSYREEYADGGQKRDFLYVKDAVAATIFLAEQVDGGGLYNVGSGEANAWLTLANAIFAAQNLAPRIDFVDMPDELRGKYQYFTCASIRKLRASGYTAPITPLAEAVRDYVQSYLSRELKLGDEANGMEERR